MAVISEVQSVGIKQLIVFETNTTLVNSHIHKMNILNKCIFCDYTMLEPVNK